MSEEDSPDLTKSWVFVDSNKKSEEPDPQTSGVEEVSENDNHLDSDTDSISVISESGCSYKTDEEEFVPAPTSLESEEVTTPETEDVTTPESQEVTTPESQEVSTPEFEEVSTPESEEISTPESEEVSFLEGTPEITEVPEYPPPANGNDRYEKLLYFATSAICALILIGFSIIIQHYFNGSSNVNKFAADFDQKSDLPVSHYINVKNQDESSLKRYAFKKKGQPRIEEMKAADNFHDKIALPSAPIKNNDLTVEDYVKSNYKSSKNKSPATKFNKENSDDSDERSKNENKNFNEIRAPKKYRKEDKDSKNRQNDENYDKRLKELKIKENYLREKEKFLIEKEHHLMKREIKLNQGKQQNYGKNKYEKKTYHKKDKEHKLGSEETESLGKQIKFRQKKHFDENNNPKSNKKYKNKEDKKGRHDHNQHKVIDDTQHKKRNVSGQWYIDLHKARNSIRKKERASDWVFDRARLRNLKRNKAHWYFQWMVDRARLRVK